MRPIPRLSSAALVWIVAVLPMTGCGIIQAGKDITRAGFRQFTPKTSDYADATDYGQEEPDEWEFVGSEGRGGMQREKESDGLTKWISSPKARSIERNLGYD
jgi:hypothetical protein